MSCTSSLVPKNALTTIFFLMYMKSCYYFVIVFKDICGGRILFNFECYLGGHYTHKALFWELLVCCVGFEFLTY